MCRLLKDVTTVYTWCIDKPCTQAKFETLAEVRGCKLLTTLCFMVSNTTLAQTVLTSTNLFFQNEGFSRIMYWLYYYNVGNRIFFHIISVLWKSILKSLDYVLLFLYDLIDVSAQDVWNILSQYFTSYFLTILHTVWTFNYEINMK